ncbi:hypothetical protein CBL_08540 [Carabus blaptoides fortunei]
MAIHKFLLLAGQIPKGTVNFARSEDWPEEFITALYTLSEHCEFDKGLSEKLQLHSDLTLDTAITMVKQSEQVKKQNPIIHGGASKKMLKSTAFVRKRIELKNTGTKSKSFKGDLVKDCPECAKETRNAHEPLLPAEFPKRPWQKLGMDLFFPGNKWYLLVMAYYSRYPEISPLTSLKW